MLTDLTRPHTTPRRCSGDAGSALMLMPAAVLILLVLGAIAADLSHVHAQKRDLISVANSIANDAVTYGLDKDQLRQGTTADGAYPFDETRIRAAIDASLAQHASLDRQIDPAQVVITFPAPRTVQVTLRSRVEYIFARSLPGSARSADIEATGIAVAEEG